MYKVQGRDNKERFRLQDFTKKDNVDIDKFVERRNRNGDKRLECDVIVMHPEELNAIYEERNKAKTDVEELQSKIIQKDIEIKRLEKEVAEHKRLNIDVKEDLQDEKFDILAGHQITLAELNETHEKDLLNINKEHRKQLERMRSHYKQSNDELNDRLFNSVKANNDLRGKYKAEMLAMKDSHKDEVVNLQKQHHEELETIQHEHSNELQALRKQHEYDIDQLKQASAQIKQEHLVEVNEINERHHVEVDEMRAKFLKLLANEHAQDLSDLNDCEDVPFYIRPFVKTHMKALDEFKKRKYLNTPQKIVESYELVQHRNE